jgi:uncharacterized protein YcnI
VTAVSSRLASHPIRVGVVTAALLLCVYSLAIAHAVVYPKASTTGAHERYVIRVPNERAVATTRVEIQFPSMVKVGSFIDVPGWTLEVVRDSAKRITGAVWTGNLPPERFVEFPFVATNPKEPTDIRWPIVQTYADGERAEWTGPTDSKRPASVTNVTSVTAPAPVAGASAAAGANPMISYAALALAVISLGLSLRRPTKG